MSKPNPWVTDVKTIEVQSSEGLEMGQAERYGVFYPADGFFSAGMDKATATHLLESALKNSGTLSEGAYIVKYSIERVED